MALVLGPLLVMAYIGGLPFGPKGVALAYSAVFTLWTVPHIAWCIRDTPIAWQDILKACGKPFLSASVAAVVAMLAKFLVWPSLSPFPQIVLGGGALLLVYLFMLFYVMGQKDFYLDLLRVIVRRPPVSGTESATVL